MPFFNFLRKPKKKKGGKTTERSKKRALTISEFTKELGIGREGVIGSYKTEENPDKLKPADYIEMQRNDGEVQAIVRLLTLPIVSTPIHVLPGENDHGERDFIEAVFLSPPYSGGMTTPLPFVVADMTRAIFEGFRLYEKVARIIEDGKYKGKVGWKKLAPRDAQTVELKADKHGGFEGAYQSATFGADTVEVTIPPEKCMLYTFQKEKHWLYGESILRAAYYHYDKKHKLYYISHKKAEIDTTGLKILKINQLTTAAEREAAEDVVDTIGVNTRVTLPPGIELEIQRGGEKGFDPMPLIEHHNNQMAKSALAQVLDQTKYDYPYGKGTPSAEYIDLSIESIMRQMEATLNIYAVAPLINWNFGTQSYPQIKFEKLSNSSKVFLREVFTQIVKKGDTLPEGFINEVVVETAKALRLKWTMEDSPKKKPSKKEPPKKEPPEEESPEGKKAYFAFERGKKLIADKLKIDAPRTPKELKIKLLNLKSQPDLEAKCYKLGEKFAYGIYRKQAMS